MELRFNISINFERNYLAAYFSSFAFSDLCNTDVVPSFQVVFVNNPLLWLPLYFFVPLERNYYAQQNSMQKHKNSNKPECKWKSLMCWPAILLTLINNLGTIGTWCSSPSHIIYPIISRAVCPFSPLAPWGPWAPVLPTGPWSPLGPGGPGNGLFLSGLPASPERKKTCPYESSSHGKVLLLCLLDIFSLRDDGEVQGSARKWFSPFGFF